MITTLLACLSIAAFLWATFENAIGQVALLVSSAIFLSAAGVSYAVNCIRDLIESGLAEKRYAIDNRLHGVWSNAECVNVVFDQYTSTVIDTDGNQYEISSRLFAPPKKLILNGGRQFSIEFTSYDTMKFHSANGAPILLRKVTKA